MEHLRESIDFTNGVFLSIQFWESPESPLRMKGGGKGQWGGIKARQKMPHLHLAALEDDET
jgi:hypothetical protein